MRKNFQEEPKVLVSWVSVIKSCVEQVLNVCLYKQSFILSNMHTHTFMQCIMINLICSTSIFWYMHRPVYIQKCPQNAIYGQPHLSESPSCFSMDLVTTKKTKMK